MHANGRETGKVKWFSGAKGYGFIERHAGGKDLFVHFSGIDGEGYRELKADQLVEFEVVEGEKGPIAARVRVRE